MKNSTIIHNIHLREEKRKQQQHSRHGNKRITEEEKTKQNKTLPKVELKTNKKTKNKNQRTS